MSFPFLLDPARKQAGRTGNLSLIDSQGGEEGGELREKYGTEKERNTERVRMEILHVNCTSHFFHSFLPLPSFQELTSCSFWQKEEGRLFRNPGRFFDQKRRRPSIHWEKGKKEAALLLGKMPSLSSFSLFDFSSPFLPPSPLPHI